jgi:hypothetical protein
MNKKLKLYNLIVKDFIKNYCKFVEATYDIKVYMYIDQNDIEDPFIFDIEEIQWALSSDLYDSIGKGTSSGSVDKGFEYVLGNYGLIGREQYEVFRMIFKELIEIIKRGYTGSINESVDKKEVYFNFIINDIVNNRLKTEIIGNDIRITFNGRSLIDAHRLAIEETIIDTINAGYDPDRYIVDREFKTLMGDYYGIYDKVDQIEIYNDILYEILDKYQNTGSINESIDKKEVYLKYIINSFIENHMDIRFNYNDIAMYINGYSLILSNRRNLEESILESINLGFQPDRFQVDGSFRTIMEEYYGINDIEDQTTIFNGILWELLDRYQ